MYQDHTFLYMYFSIRLISLTTGKMIPGLARASKRTTYSSIINFLINCTCRYLNIVREKKIRGQFHSKYKMNKLLKYSKFEKIMEKKYVISCEICTLFVRLKGKQLNFRIKVSIYHTELSVLAGSLSL